MAKGGRAAYVLHALPKPMNKSPVPFLRRIALIEGWSFLILLGIAMPLKYFADMPMAVKIVGWAHGVLFVLLCWALLQTLLNTRWSIFRCATVFIAALLPFGPFLLDGKMAQWQNEEATTGDLSPSA